VIAAEQDQSASGRAGGPTGEHSTSEELRTLHLPQQRFGGYAREAVDETIGMAARAIDRLAAELRTRQDEIARLQLARGELESELEVTTLPSPAEVVGDILVTAHRAAEAVIEEAHRALAGEREAARQESSKVLARARRLLEEAAAAHRHAQIVVADAHARAQALTENAQVEARNLVAGATESAARRRSQLEMESARLETAIMGLRNEWVGRAAEALVRLDGLELEPTPELGHVSETAAELPADLRSRLRGESQGAAPSPPEVPS
jgi:cell division septum initiation protein DivIVA